MEWISVEDHMPEVHADVLVYAGGIQSGATYEYRDWWTREGDLWDKQFVFPVSHWQPCLPAPPAMTAVLLIDSGKELGKPARKEPTNAG